MSTTQEYDGGEKVDCKITEWNEWTSCRDCRGYTTKTREIIVNNNASNYRINVELFILSLTLLSIQ